MGLSRLAQQGPGTQTGFQLPLAQGGHGQTAWSPSSGALEAVFSVNALPNIIPRCVSRCGPMDAWWTSRKKSQGLAKCPRAPRDQTFTKNLCVSAENLSGNVLMLKTVNSFEPWRYRHSQLVHCAHQKGGTLCVGGNLQRHLA